MMPPDVEAMADNRSAQVIQIESSRFIPLLTVMSAASMVASLVALSLVMFKLNDYADQIALEKRLQTQAVDELRVEANVSRKLAGLPVIDSQAHE